MIPDLEQPSRRWPKWWPAIALVALAIIAGTIASWFIVPPPTMPGHVIVPALRGLTVDQATAKLKQEELLLRTGEELADPVVAAGSVSWQSPVAETQLPRGSTVMVGLSTGAPMIVVPDLVNFDVELASQVLAASGLKIGPIDTVTNLADPGAVISSRPEAGVAVRPGTLIALTLSGGAPPEAVPSVVGLTLRDARARIEAAGFRIGLLTRRLEGRPGTVLSQEPRAGTVRAKASTIDLTISGALR